MATCSNNPRLGRVGCGQTFGGEMQHSVARVSWSTHPDGMAHITGRLSTIEACWSQGLGKNGNGEMANPVDLGFHQDARGVWRQPGRDEEVSNFIKGLTTGLVADEEVTP